MSYVPSSSMNLKNAKSLSKKSFFEYRDKAIDLMVETLQENGAPIDIAREFKECLDYNTQDGKFLRGLSTVEIFVLITNELNSAVLERACLIGWIVEIMHALFLILDDIMDKSALRRGQPCWYKLEHVGLRAINDGFLMKSCILALVQKLTRGTSGIKFCEFLVSVFLRTSIGQAMDMKYCYLGSQITKIWLNTKPQYIHSFYLYMLAVSWLAFNSILEQMGLIFQIQDDYLDVYGDSEVTGKIGTDIQEGKCTWLSVEALKVTNELDHEIMKNNYGKLDEKCVHRVRDIFRKYHIKDRCIAHLKALARNVEDQLKSMPPSLLISYYEEYIHNHVHRVK
ncbi:Farnesyl pyrophosphate synthase [Thelohanellus kitauei]|uniref:Farnesyl pyrophosphate synthase n=1 Tax=Thelohanellus kitauei TaxID=669202 RepID=A0A0C2IXQ4_THEKT|nr:Farnesyl pyrophosphate synthase [Thelohanellus kitauei]